MSEDKIVINGVEYERCQDRDSEVRIPVRPKRKQTGDICIVCSSVYCVSLQRPNTGGMMINKCPRALWRPFYGKVVE